MANADGILPLIVVAGGVDMYGASVKGKDPVIPLIGAFVVGAFLLAVAESAPELAELFAAAFTITSLLANGTPLIQSVNNLVNSGNTPPNAQQQAANAATNRFNSINPQVTNGYVQPSTFSSINPQAFNQ